MLSQTLIHNAKPANPTAKTVWQGFFLLCHYRDSKRGKVMPATFRGGSAEGVMAEVLWKGRFEA